MNLMLARRIVPGRQKLAQFSVSSSYFSSSARKGPEKTTPTKEKTTTTLFSGGGRNLDKQREQLVKQDIVDFNARCGGTWLKVSGFSKYSNSHDLIASIENTFGIPVLIPPYAQISALPHSVTSRVDRQSPNSLFLNNRFPMMNKFYNSFGWYVNLSVVNSSASPPLSLAAATPTSDVTVSSLLAAMLAVHVSAEEPRARKARGDQAAPPVRRAPGDLSSRYCSQKIVFELPLPLELSAALSKRPLLPFTSSSLRITSRLGSPPSTSFFASNVRRVISETGYPAGLPDDCVAVRELSGTKKTFVVEFKDERGARKMARSKRELLKMECDCQTFLFTL